MLLDGKIVIVASGSKGIGKNIAKLFYQHGAALYLLASDLQVLAQTCREIDIQKTGKIHFIQCDIGYADSVKQAFDRLKQQQVIPDILINCTSFNLNQKAADNKFDSWYKVLNLNLTGSYLTSNFCSSLFKQKGGGTIINIGPICCNSDLDTMYKYIAKSGTVELVTKACAITYQQHNINCYGIAINTDDIDNFVNNYSDDLVNFIAKYGASAEDYVSTATATALYLASNSPKDLHGKLFSCTHIGSKL